jgi:tripartite-type tricarboxylate transporter receptor subunit TctC
MTLIPARLVLSGVAALALFVSLTNAQEFPEHAVKVIVPSSPGGGIDVTGRVIGQKLQEKWGKPVIIENRPGASMQIGADAVAKSRQDGYTLLVAHDGSLILIVTLGFHPGAILYYRKARKALASASGCSSGTK